MDSKSIVEAQGIYKSFGATKALADVSIDLRPGEVHGLVGENGAGKSTLINILSGVFPADQGDIYLDGEPITFKSPRQAQEVGIGSVHQELALCPTVSIAENIFMGHPDKSHGVMNYSELFKSADKLLAQFHAGINSRHRAEWLSIAQQQVVEIVKALSFNCKVLILDEPTSSLTENESETLFEIINELKNRNIAILYVSHRMSEIFELSDRITIFRDGRHIDTIFTNEVAPETVVSKMVGRRLSTVYPEKREKPGNVVLEVKNLSKKGVFENISFELREKEVLGFSGLVGAGRTELARGICCIDEVDSGDVYLDGEELESKNYEQVIEKGLVYLPEDRKIAGLFLSLTIQSNISAAALGQITKNGFIDFQQEKAISNEYAQKLNIRLRSLKQLAGELSGGNQQKTMVAKWLATKPRVIIMDEPTRGIDVGAKVEIYKLINELTAEGIGVIMISSELPEIIGMCDRVIVMYEGQYQGIVTGESITEEKIMTLAAPHANSKVG